VALAVASTSRGVALAGAPRACFGELGLTGELRWVGHPERRLQEAAKHGLSSVIAPPGSGSLACEVLTLRQALAAALPPGPSGPRGRSSGRGESPVALVGEVRAARRPRALHSALEHPQGEPEQGGPPERSDGPMTPLEPA
jgi:hypothetical protein